MNNLTRRRRSDAAALALISRFIWLRTSEFGKLRWPNSKAQLQQASRLLKCLERRRLVVSRTLPLRSGTAYVLSELGVKTLALEGIKAKPGTSLGKKSINSKDGWTPDINWRHDLIAANVIADFVKQGATFLTEPELRAKFKANEISIKSNENPNESNKNSLEKIPDAIIMLNKRIIWLEVENSRKSGKNMRELANALISATTVYIQVSHLTVNEALLAYPDDALDELEHSVDHFTRVRNAIAQKIDEKISIKFARCSMKSVSVESIDYFEESINSERWRYVFKELMHPELAKPKFTWSFDKDRGTYTMNYRNFIRLTITKFKNRVEGSIFRPHEVEEVISGDSFTHVKELLARSIFLEVM